MSYDIVKRCHFDRSRFGQAAKRMAKQYDHNLFERDVKEVLNIAIAISDDPKMPRHRSNAYLSLFTSDNPTIDLGGLNPFYVYELNRSLSIDLVFDFNK